MRKRISCVFTGLALALAFALAFPFGLLAQRAAASPSQIDNGVSQIPARNLLISCNKTCMLIFPSAIQSADRGAAYVLAERVKGSENALKVKAGRPGFQPSSLTVITTDGKVYPFKVYYAAQPPYLVLDFKKEGRFRVIDSDSDSDRDNERESGEKGEREGDHNHISSRKRTDSLQIPINGVSGDGNDKQSSSTSVKFKGVSLNSGELDSCAQRVGHEEARFIHGVHKRLNGVNFRLSGIYYHREVLFFKFNLINKSGLPYQYFSLRFFIRDNKTARRTVVQDNELQGLQLRSWGKPEAGQGQTIVVALPRFTIADHKHLMVELMEKNGDRAMMLRVKERQLRKTRKLFEL